MKLYCVCASICTCILGQQGKAGAVAPSRPSFGAAADRAAAHQFARSLSHKTSLTSSPDRQCMPSMPESPFAGGKIAAGGIPETPQQGSGVPPSMRVRALSRQFSEKTQQPHTARLAAMEQTHRAPVFCICLVIFLVASPFSLATRNHQLCQPTVLYVLTNMMTSFRASWLNHLPGAYYPLAKRVECSVTKILCRGIFLCVCAGI